MRRNPIQNMLILAVVLIGALSAASTFASDEGPRIAELSFADEVRGYADYTANLDGIFRKGDRAFLYFVVEGISSEKKGRDYRTRVDAGVAITTLGGFPVFSRKNAVRFDETADYPQESLWFYFWVNIPAWMPSGEYLVKITVTDRTADKEVVEVRTVTVE